MRGAEQIPWLYDGFFFVSDHLGFERWRAWLTGGARGRTLEVGCGTGLLAAALAERASARVWAVDREPAMVDIARTRMRGVKVGRAEELPFKDAWFERAVLRQVIQHLDRPRALPELRRVLAPHGRAVIATFDDGHFRSWWLNAFFPEIGEIDAARFPSPASLCAELEEAGVKVKVGEDCVRVMGDAAPLEAADISTEEYPGFPTDAQAQYMTLMTQAAGTSVITENIFENRFMHALELWRMGASIKIEGGRAVVRGRTALSGAAVQASDLRASASLVLAALVAEDETIIDRVYHIDRGYERIEEKLRGVGAQVKRIGEILPRRAGAGA